MATHLLWATALTLYTQTVIDTNNFTAETLFSGEGSISIDFGPGGELLVCEKRGRVLRLVPPVGNGDHTAAVVYDLRGSVFTNAESGLLGMVLDPDFATNRHMFLFYSTQNDQRLVRVTVASNWTVSGPETVILSGLPRATNFHNGGDIDFHPNDPNNIFISLGDDGAAHRAQDPNYYQGKILRVNKTNGAGLVDNPFYVDNVSAVRARVWAVGLRNPFRFSFHPNPPIPDVVYVSENGDSTDRISWVRKGSNGSWSTAGDSGGFLSPPDTNHKVMLTTSPATLGIAIAGSGPFASGGDPVLYVGNWTGARSVRRYRLTGANRDTAVAIDPIGMTGRFVDEPGTHLEFGPDGALYGTHSQNDLSLGGWLTVWRVRPVAGLAPIASFTTSPEPPTGDAPLTVQFTDTSNDPDGTIASRLWNFGDGTMSTAANPSHEFTFAATFPVTLRVTDNSGLIASTGRDVVVTQNSDLVVSGSIFDGRVVADQSLNDTLEVRFYREDGTTPLMPNNMISVSGGQISQTVTAELLSPRVVVSVGENSGFQPSFSSHVVNASAASNAITVNARLSNTAIRGRVFDRTGDPAETDIGVARDHPSLPFAFSGGRDYGAGIPASGAAHRLNSDVGGYYYVPIKTGSGGADFFVDLATDTNTDRYIATTVTVPVTEGANQSPSLIVDHQTGGKDCATVTTATSAVDYDADVQTIWDAKCISCHQPGRNMAGLDLSAPSAARITNSGSAQRPIRTLVVPNDPQSSYLVEKFNCAHPEAGARMHSENMLTLTERSTVWGWITQMAPVAPRDAGIHPDATITDSGTGTGEGTTDAGPSTTADDPMSSTCACGTTPGTGSDWFLLLVPVVIAAVLRGDERRRIR